MQKIIYFYTNSTREFFERLAKGISPTDPETNENEENHKMYATDDISEHLVFEDAPIEDNKSWEFRRAGDTEYGNQYIFGSRVKIDYDSWSKFWERYVTAVMETAKRDPDIDGNIDILATNVVDYRDVIPGIGIIDLVIITRDETLCTEAEEA